MPRLLLAQLAQTVAPKLKVRATCVPHVAHVSGRWPVHIGLPFRADQRCSSRFVIPYPTSRPTALTVWTGCSTRARARVTVASSAATSLPNPYRDAGNPSVVTFGEAVWAPLHQPSRDGQHRKLAVGISPRVGLVRRDEPTRLEHQSGGRQYTDRRPSATGRSRCDGGWPSSLRRRGPDGSAFAPLQLEVIRAGSGRR